MADMITKGRANKASGDRNGARTKPEKHARGEHSGAYLHPELFRGENNGRAKLTWEQVQEIKALTANSNKYKALAQRFGVTTTQIMRIAKGIAWTKK